MPVRAYRRYGVASVPISPIEARRALGHSASSVEPLGEGGSHPLPVSWSSSPTAAVHTARSPLITPIRPNAVTPTRRNAHTPTRPLTTLPLLAAHSALQYAETLKNDGLWPGTSAVPIRLEGFRLNT